MYAEVPGRERVLSRQGQTFHRKVTKAACRHNSREAAGIVAAGRKKAAEGGGKAAKCGEKHTKCAVPAGTPP